MDTNTKTFCAADKFGGASRLRELLSAKIRKFREENDLSQTQLNKLCGFAQDSRQFLSKPINKEAESRLEDVRRGYSVGIDVLESDPSRITGRAVSRIFRVLEVSMSDVLDSMLTKDDLEDAKELMETTGVGHAVACGGRPGSVDLDKQVALFIRARALNELDAR